MKITGEFEIKNTMGLHTRPAAEFARTALRFDADITVEKDGDVVNGKSIMSLLMLSAGQGSFLKITASGADAKEALNAIETLIEAQFNEG